MSARAPADAVFRLRQVGKVYAMGQTQIHALRDVDLDLYAGEFVVLLGASGSGKSTLLNIIGGLDCPSSGQVSYRDHYLSAANAAQLSRYRREHVGFVFQFYNLIPSLTALENVALVTQIAPSPMPPAEALALVDMQQRAGHFPAQLSGGEQQRVAIARAVAKRPDVLLCDEPTGALDYATGKRVLLEGWGGDAPLRAVVRRVEPYAFTKVSALGVEEKRVNVVADFVDSPGAVGDGFRVTGRIVVWQSPQVRTVPVSALLRCAEQWCVLAVQQGRVVRRIVELGQRNLNQAQVLAGLANGEQVVRYPGSDLLEGQRVRAR